MKFGPDQGNGFDQFWSSVFDLAPFSGDKKVRS